MAIEMFDGFEAGTPAPEWSAALPPAIASGAGNARTGTYYMTSRTNGQQINLTATAKKTIGLAFQTSVYSVLNVIQFLGDTQATVHLTLSLDTSGHLVVRRGTSSGTVLATSTQVFPLNEWRHLQMQATIADSGGTCIVKVDGTDWINFTGDTKNAGTNTTIDGIFLLQSGSSNTYLADDLWVCNGTDDTATTGRPDNDFLGDLHVEGILPTGNGNSSQFVGSDGNSTDNYLLVDDPTINTTDYVGSATPGNRDSYVTGDLASYVSAVYAVRVSAYAAKSDAGAAGIKVGLRESGGTVTLAASQALSTTYATYWDALRKVNPTGSTAWSAADVNGIQITIEQAAA